VRGDRQEIGLELRHVDLDPARALHRVDVEHDALLAAELADLPDRLDHADLVVHHHDRDQDGVGPDRRFQLFQADDSVGLDFEVGRLEALALELAHRVEHRLVLGLWVTMCLPFVL
jgi:hypothetical protein